MTLKRIEALLQALAIMASEFGPLFVHSVEGQATLQTGVRAIQALSVVTPALIEVAEHPPVAA